MALTNLLDQSKKADAIYRTGTDKKIDQFLQEISPDAFAHHKDITQFLRDGRNVGATGPLAGDLAHVDGHGSLTGNGGSSAFDFGGEGYAGTRVENGKLPSGVKTSAKSAYRNFDQMAKDARKVGEKLHKDIGRANEDLATHYKNLVEDIESISPTAVRGKNGVLTGTVTAPSGGAPGKLEITIAGEKFNIAAAGGREQAKDAAKKWLDGRTELLEEYRGLVADKYGDFKEFILEARGKIKDTTGILNKYGKTEASESAANAFKREMEVEAPKVIHNEGATQMGHLPYMAGGAVVGGLIGYMTADEENKTRNTAVGAGVGAGGSLLLRAMTKPKVVLGAIDRLPNMSQAVQNGLHALEGTARHLG